MFGFSQHLGSKLRRSRWLAVALLVGSALLILGGAPSARADFTWPDHVVVSVSPSAPSVGQDITVKAVAKDASGDTSGLTGTGTWYDSAGALATALPLTYIQFENGVATIVAHADKPLHNDVINVHFGPASGTSRAFNVLGPLDHLTTSIPSGLKVNSPFAITLSARDAANNLLTGYTGALSWSDSAGAVPSPDPFSGGVSKTTVQLANPVRSDRLTISTGGLSVARSLSVIGPVTKLDLQAPTSVAVATQFKVVSLARDAAGNLVPDYSAPASWSDSAGAITPSAPSDFVKGVSTTIAQVPAPVKSDVVTLASGGMSGHRTLNAVGPVDHFAVAWKPGNVASDCSSATGSVVVRAVDVAGNVVTSYNSSSAGWYIESGAGSVISRQPR
jgi:hypothetical protein